MKAAINQLWWNPWGEEGLDVGNRKVSISIDNLSFDKEADYRILFLAEPYAIAPSVNEGALRNAHNFNRIYTFTQSILEKYPQAQCFEWGSSWLDFNELNIDKKPHITFVTSSKLQTTGHKTRNQIMDMLEDIEDVNGMEVYAHKSPPFHQRRNDFFENAMYHIAVENSRQKNYFTEKIIDCFASRTIPIYWGCPNLDKWFDMDGVIRFNHASELKKIFDKLDEDFYHSRKEVIEKNYEIAKKFYGENDVVPRLTKTIINDVEENAIVYES